LRVDFFERDISYQLGKSVEILSHALVFSAINTKPAQEDFNPFPQIHLEAQAILKSATFRKERTSHFA
jgi:hypothetical protein